MGPPIIPERNPEEASKPVATTFHTLSVKSIAEYETKLFPFESNATHVILPVCPSSTLNLVAVLTS
jgi:hypothetical protein